MSVLPRKSSLVARATQLAIDCVGEVADFEERTRAGRAVASGVFRMFRWGRSKLR